MKTDLSIEDSLKGKELVKLFRRPFMVQRIQSVLKGVKELGIKNFCIIPQENKVKSGDYYALKEELEDVAEKAFDLFLNQEKFDGHIEDYKDKKNKLLEELSAVENIESVDNKRGAELYNSYTELITASDFAEPYLIPASLGLKLEPYLKEELKEYVDDINKAWEIVGSATSLINIQKLQRRVSEYYIEGILEEKIPELLEKYRWITVYEINQKPADKSYFKDLVLGEDKEEIRSKIEEMEKEVEENKRELDDLLNKIDKKDLKAGIKNLNHYITFRANRMDALREATYYIRVFLKKLLNSEKIKDSYNLFSIANTTIRELKRYFDKGELPSPEILKKRLNKENYHYYKGGEFRLIESDERKSIIEKVVGLKGEADEKYLEGSTAYKGKLKGEVKIIEDMNDMEKIEEGDILVTSMTKPEFMPAIKRSAAIITDEGGITCHAAIIARELEKPCIIGTKEATRILEDGDKVKIDAEEGVAKNIN